MIKQTRSLRPLSEKRVRLNPIILGRYSPSQNGIVVSPFGPALCLAGGAMVMTRTNQRY